jgi:hypothetical protein
LDGREKPKAILKRCLIGRGDDEKTAGVEDAREFGEDKLRRTRGRCSRTSDKVAMEKWESGKESGEWTTSRERHGQW